MTDQLDLFHQPVEEAVREGSPEPELDGALTPSRSEQPDARANAQSLAPFSDRLRNRRWKTQISELAGETWEDAFGDAA